MLVTTITYVQLHPECPGQSLHCIFLDVKGESVSLSCESLSMFQAEKRFPVVNKVEAVVNNLQEKQRISYNLEIT
jgi:hypothetical protein